MDCPVDRSLDDHETVNDQTANYALLDIVAQQRNQIEPSHPSEPPPL